MSGQYVSPVRRVSNGKGHWYRDANGNRVPGVTTIIGDGVPKPALINWAGNATADYAVDHWDELTAMMPSARGNTLRKARYFDRDTAANRGTAVHNIAERLVHGNEVDVPDELAGHVGSYVRFLDEWDVRPILVERTVVSHRHGYAGTLDLLAELVDHSDIDAPPQVWLLDIKTNRFGIFGETALQLAGYRYADVWMDQDDIEHPMPVVQRTGAIHVRADDYDLVPVEAGPEQHRDLLYAQQVGRFLAQANSLVGEPLKPWATSTYRLLREEQEAVL